MTDLENHTWLAWAISTKLRRSPDKIDQSDVSALEAIETVTDSTRLSSFVSSTIADIIMVRAGGVVFAECAYG